MSTQRYVSITSSPTVMQEQSFMAVKFQGWNVQGATDWRYAQGNLEPFFYPSFTSALHHCIPHLLSGKKYKYRHLKSCRLYEIHFGLSYWNEVQQQLLRPLSDLVPNWLFHIRGPCSLCSHRAGMLDSTAATKATIYQLWLHTFWSIAPLNC